MIKIKKISLTFTLLLSFFWLLPSASQAHKVQIFAYGEGDSIVGETAFSGGRKPKDSEIIVQDAVGAKTLFTCRTDDQGRFRFPIPPEARRGHLNLRIIINVGDGHRGEWLLAAEEYLTGGEAASVAVDNQEKSAVHTASAAGEMAQTIPLNQVLGVMEEAVDKKLIPLKRMLAQRQNQGPRFQDILGGIGYILGLTGIAAYFKSKNLGRKDA